jgi:hypothetical protein
MENLVEKSFAQNEKKIYFFELSWSVVSKFQLILDLLKSKSLQGNSTKFQDKIFPTTSELYQMNVS